MAMPTESLDRRFSDPAALPTPWATSAERLARAEVAWIVTVRPDGRPHSTPVVPVFHDDRMYFHTGRREVKHANLQANPNILVLVGDTEWDRGLDVMFEGTATPITDPEALRRVADLFRTRWDGRWILEPADGRLETLAAPDVEIVVYEVTPTKARGHSKGEPFGQTTYQFRAERSPAPLAQEGIR